MESHYKYQQLKHQYVSLNLKTLKIIHLFQKRYTQTILEMKLFIEQLSMKNSIKSSKIQEGKMYCLH